MSLSAGGNPTVREGADESMTSDEPELSKMICKF